MIGGIISSLQQSHTSHGVFVVVLGNAQDAGVPHIGCLCYNCERARETNTQQYCTSLAIVDARQHESKVWLIDATPDINHQMYLLREFLQSNHPARLNKPNGIFLTHAHMGHIGGLLQFGKESWGGRGLNVYALEPLIDLLKQSKHLQPTVKNFDFHSLTHGQAVSLAEDIHIEPFVVPHRDEWSVGTVGYKIVGPDKQLLYIPDIDSWDEWPEAYDCFSAADIVMVDACFYSSSELPQQLNVPHPVVVDTVNRFADQGHKIVLTHLNHTNPLHNHSSDEYRAVTSAGFRVAQTSDQHSLLDTNTR